MHVRVRFPAAAALLVCSLVSAQWLETTINLPDASRPYALCYNSADDKVYCADYNTDSLTIVSGSTNAIVATLAVDDQPFALCYNSTSDRVYCLCTGTQKILVVDGASNAILATIGAGPYAQKLCYNPQNNKVYCSNMFGNNVTVIDGASNTVVDTVPTGSGPEHLYYHAPANEVYVTNSVGQTVSVIDGATNDIVATITGTNPLMFCGNPHDNKIYGVNCNQSNVVITDATTHAIIDTVTGVWQPTAIVYNEHNNTVYVNSRTGTPSSIKTIDGTTNQLGDSISITGPSTMLCYNRYTNKLFTEDQAHVGVFVIDCATNMLLKTIATDSQPYCMVWNPADNRVYVGCWMMVPWASSGISVIRDSGGGVEESPRPQAPIPWLGPTVVCGVLRLAEETGVLFDFSGRRVADLRRGANDVSGLPSGVYFVRASCCRKVLVQR